MKFIKTPIFRGLDELEFDDMDCANCMREESFEKNELIFHAGDIVNKIGIVTKGSVNIENIDLLGNKSILNNISSGEVFAETYALCHEPMMVDAVAAEKCEVLFLELDILNNGENRTKSWYRKIMSNMLQVSVRKNLVLSNRIFCTTAKTIRSRLLTYLSAVSIKAGSKTFQIPFDRQQMADYLNVERTALSKELGKMKKEGIIDFYKNSFRLLIND